VKPEIIKAFLKAQNKDRHWLARQCNVSKQTVDGWLSANRPISAPATQILKGLIDGTKSINPRLTLEEYNRAQVIAAKKGMTLEEWISSLIVAALKLVIIGGILWILIA